MARKRGGQPGNQNARTHGYYTRVLDEPGRLNVKRAASVKGLDQEIDLLRAKIVSIVQNDPDNARLLMQGCVSLARLLRTQSKLAQGGDVGLKEAGDHLYQQYVRPMGIPRDQFLKPEL